MQVPGAGNSPCSQHFIGLIPYFAWWASYWAPVLNAFRNLGYIERLQVIVKDHDLLYGLTIIPAWITNHLPSSVWDETTYTFPNFSWNLRMYRNIMPQFAGHVNDYLSMPGCRLIHVDKTCKRALGYQSDTWTANTRMIWKICNFIKLLNAHDFTSHLFIAQLSQSFRALFQYLTDILSLDLVMTQSRDR